MNELSFTGDKTQRPYDVIHESTMTWRKRELAEYQDSNEQGKKFIYDETDEPVLNNEKLPAPALCGELLAQTNNAKSARHGAHMSNLNLFRYPNLQQEDEEEAMTQASPCPPAGNTCQGKGG